MILRLLTALIILYPLASFARLEGELAIPDHQEHEKCNQLLLNGFFNSYTDSGNFQVNASKGLGYRQWLGPNPGESLLSTLAAFKQTLLWWDYSFTVVKSIEEARKMEIDRKIPHVYKTAYIISDFDVSHFTEDTPSAVLLAAFQAMFHSSRVVEIVDSYDAKGRVIADKYDVVEVRKSDFMQLADLNKIYWSSDWRGRHFSFDGWTQLQYRGVLSYEEIFRLSANGRIADDDIRRVMKRVLDFIQVEGGTFQVNYDFEKSLKLLGEMERDNGFGKMVPNSRYADPNSAEVARELYRRGQAFTMEAVSKDGRILANQLGFITGRLFSGDTVLLDNKDPDLARAVILVGMIILHQRYGVSYMDGNVSSKFSKQVGSRFIPYEDFEKMARPLIEAPSIRLERREFSLDELPFQLENRAVWLDAKGNPAKPPTPKKVKPQVAQPAQ